MVGLVASARRWTVVVPTSSGLEREIRVIRGTEKSQEGEGSAGAYKQSSKPDGARGGCSRCWMSLEREGRK